MPPVPAERDPTPARAPASESLHTPSSLHLQRVDAPSLDEQLAAYEARYAVMEEVADVDPATAQWVGLLVAVVAGVLAAGAVAGLVGAMVWML